MPPRFCFGPSKVLLRPIQGFAATCRLGGHTDSPSQFSSVRIAQCEHRSTSQRSEYNRSSTGVNNEPEWLPSESSKQRLGCCHIQWWRLRTTMDTRRLVLSTAVRTKFARATRETVTPNEKGLCFLLSNITEAGQRAGGTTITGLSIIGGTQGHFHWSTRDRSLSACLHSSSWCPA